MTLDATLPAATFVARIVVGLLLLWAGATKLRDWSGLAVSIHQYVRLPASIERVVARMLPFVEIIAGGSLLVGLLARWAAVVIAGLLLLFIVAVALNLARGRRFPCMCFGMASEELNWWMIYRNVGLLLLSLTIWRAAYLPVSLDDALLRTHSEPASLEHDVQVGLVWVLVVFLWWFAGQTGRRWQHLRH